MANLNLLEEDLKKLIVKSLRLEDTPPHEIKSDAPLFVKGLGLDSIDALELSVALAKQYGLSLNGKTDYKTHFSSVHHLALFVAANRKGKNA